MSGRDSNRDRLAGAADRLAAISRPSSLARTPVPGMFSKSRSCASGIACRLGDRHYQINIGGFFNGTHNLSR
jgi:hypothetical protein